LTVYSAPIPHASAIASAGAQYLLSPNWSLIASFTGNFASGFRPTPAPARCAARDEPGLARLRSIDVGCTPLTFGAASDSVAISGKTDLAGRAKKTFVAIWFDDCRSRPALHRK
jgi:hypothetical protein